jgi:hypothetical protein
MDFERSLNKKNMLSELKCFIRIGVGFLFICLLTVGCSSGGGVEGGVVSEIDVTLALYDKNTGSSTDTVTSNSPGVLVATLTDAFGNPMPGITIQFTTLVVDGKLIGLIVPKDGLATTDGSGQATVQLSPGPGAGVGTAQAKYDEFSDSLNFTSDGSDPAAVVVLSVYQVFGPDEDPPPEAIPAPGGGLMAKTDQLAAGSTGLLRADLVNAFGEPIPWVEIAFGSTLPTITPESPQATTDENGAAYTFFSVDPGATAGTGVLTATYNSIKDSVFITVTVKVDI